MDEQQHRLIGIENFINTINGEIKYWQDEIDNLDMDKMSEMRKAQRHIENLWLERIEMHERYRKLKKQSKTNN